MSRTVYCVSLSSIVRQAATNHNGPIHIKVDVDGIEEDVCQSLFDSKLDPEETDVSKLGKGRSTDEFLEGRDKVVDYLLFRDETPIPKVSCDPAFRRAFTANRIADSRKRSLKDLRLDGRIFENRCSYMIYSPTFDQFPPMLKGAIYARIHEILTSPKPVEGFDYLGKDEKRRILEILDETKEDLPPGWL